MAYTTIDDPSAYFKVQLWTGTGSSNAITFDDTDTDMQPDMVWIKVRSESNNHEVYDAVRGATERIYPDLTSVEDTNTAGLTAFGSDGFTVSTGHAVNKSSGTFVAWCWKAGGSGSSNTDGTINSTKTSANTTSGFSMVTYTGDDNSGATVGHGLGMAPSLVMVKARTKTDAWFVTSTPLGWNKYLILNDTSAESNASNNSFTGTAATSSVFSLGSDSGGNGSSYNYVAYLFSNVQGFSKVGTYTGNGNADGTFVYTGFKPAWVMIKMRIGSGNWVIHDNKRLGYNADNNQLLANTTGAGSTNDYIDILSNGFKFRDSYWGTNGTTDPYTYIAFAEAPFVNSNGVPCNAR